MECIYSVVVDYICHYMSSDVFSETLSGILSSLSTRFHCAVRISTDSGFKGKFGDLSILIGSWVPN
jgi:hypothetical protein